MRKSRHDRPSLLAAASVAISAGRGEGRPGAPLNVPPVAASTFVLGGAHGYARDDATPTIEAFEVVLGALEHGTAVAFSSGMAAVAAVVDRVRAGGRLAIPTVCYQGTTALAHRVTGARGATLVEVDQQDTPRWLDALRTCDVVVVESPNNPLLRIADLATIGGAVDGRRALLAVDSTLATPMAQQPLAYGADVVVHSATKAIGGHSDLLLGAVVTADPAIADDLRTHRTLHGAVPGALEAFVATRGLRTCRCGSNAPRTTPCAWRSACRHTRSSAPCTTRACARTPITRGPPSSCAGSTRWCRSSCTATRGRPTRSARSCGLIVHATSLGSVESTIERRAADDVYERVSKMLGDDQLPTRTRIRPIGGSPPRVR